MKLKLKLSREARRKFLNFRWSQTRIRPGFEAKSHRQEPDANQARIRSQEPPARARHESGQDSKPRATGKSQTRIRPGFEARGQEQECSRGREGEGGAHARAQPRPRVRESVRESAPARRLEKTIPDTQGSGKNVPVFFPEHSFPKCVQILVPSEMV